MYSVKSSTVQEEHLATSPQSVARLHLPYAIIVKLLAHDFGVITLTPVTNGLSRSLSWTVGLSILHEAMDVAVIYIKEGNKKLMILRVRFAPTLFLPQWGFDNKPLGYTRI